MPERLGPRFAVEAGFLVAVAALAAVADLSWRAIVLCMGVSWLLVVVHESARWRQESRRARAARQAPDRDHAPVEWERESGWPAP
jgi:hypothetical protein